MSYTKGPWRLRSDPSHFDSATTIEGGVVGARRPPMPQMVVQVGGDADLLTLEANARLISVAPDLLEALQMILWDEDGKEWEHSELSDKEWDARQDDARDIARTAIAKALGLDVPQKFDDDGVSELDLIGGES